MKTTQASYKIFNLFFSQSYLLISISTAINLKAMYIAYKNLYKIIYQLCPFIMTLIQLPVWRKHISTNIKDQKNATVLLKITKKLWFITIKKSLRFNH